MTGTVITRHHPAFIRQVLDTYRSEGSTAATRTHDVAVSAVHKWAQRWESDPTWCRPDQDAAWEARQAHLAKLRRYRARRYIDQTPTIVNAIGTRRRLQGLYALGWTWEQLGDYLGLSRSAIHNLGTGRGNRIGGGCHIDSHRAVVALYDRLSMIKPEGWVADRARNIAIRKQWVPPLAWDDEQLDDPDARPHVPLYRTTYKRHDLVSEYDWLIGSGESHIQALKRLGVTDGCLEKAQARVKHGATKYA